MDCATFVLESNNIYDQVKVNMFLLAAATVLSCVLSTQATLTVSLELQGGKCSDQITLICRHSDNRIDPRWIHNGTTVEGGDALGTAFPGAVYTVHALTEHTATITGVDTVQALDGYLIQCAYTDQGNLVKSNAVKFSFIPPDYQPALSLVSFTTNFSKRLSTFTYSYQKSCSLYPRCIPYFSVEHTVSPKLVVSKSSSGCNVEYTIHNLMRCVSYQSIATALIGNQRGKPVVVGDTVMQSPGQFTIINVSIGADRVFINLTYMEKPDCPSYPTERYTVDVDGVQVADLTADEFQSKITDLSNGFQTLSLPLLSQPLPEDAVTLNMTKYNTVPTNRSDVKGNIVTEMLTWGTSAVFALRESGVNQGKRESPAPGNVDGVISVSVSAGIVGIAVIGVIAVIIVVVIKWRNKKKECLQLLIMSTDNQQQEDTLGSEETQKGGVRKVLGERCN